VENGLYKSVSVQSKEFTVFPSRAVSRDEGDRLIASLSCDILSTNKTPEKCDFYYWYIIIWLETIETI
jgi:hypothetical protein